MANFNGKNKGYESRGGQATAKKRKIEYNTEYDHCACGNKKFPTQYVCKSCINLYTTQLPPTPPLISDEPEVIKNGRACRTCEHRKECAGLVVKDWPVKCEIWDELDLIVLAHQDVS